jgi:hypothetical protein
MQRMTQITEASLQRTRTHLKIVGIIFIVLGILSLLGLLGVGVLHVAFDFMMENDAFRDLPPEQVELFESLLKTLTLAIVLLIVVHVFFHGLVGVCLMCYKYYWPCYLTAVLSLLNFPFGTILGVFTLMVLSRPEARELFGLPPRRVYPPVDPK